MQLRGRAEGVKWFAVQKYLKCFYYSPTNVQRSILTGKNIQAKFKKINQMTYHDSNYIKYLFYKAM